MKSFLKEFSRIILVLALFYQSPASGTSREEMLKDIRTNYGSTIEAFEAGRAEMNMAGVDTAGKDIYMSNGGLRVSEAQRLEIERRMVSPTRGLENSSMAQVGQLASVLMILAAAEAAKSEMRARNLRAQDISPYEMAEIVGYAARKTVASFELWFAWIGSHVHTKIWEKALNGFNEMIDPRQKNGILRNLVKSGVGSAVAFLGWESGAELWKLAVHLLPSEEEVRIGQDIFIDNLVGNILTDLSAVAIAEPLKKLVYVQTIKNQDRAHPYPPSMFKKHDYQTKQRIVFLKIFKNLGTILSNHQLIDVWFYNVWRHKLTSGEFAVMFSSMVAAGAVGMKFGGFWLGMAFFLAGGAVTMIVPQEWKDYITYKTKQLRTESGERALQTNIKNLETVIYYMRTRPDAGLIWHYNSLLKELKKRKKYRQNVMNVFLERLQLQVKRLKILEGELEIGRQVLLGEVGKAVFLKMNEAKEGEVSESEGVEKFSEESLETVSELVDQIVIDIAKAKAEIKALVPRILDFYPKENEVMTSFLYDHAKNHLRGDQHQEYFEVVSAFIVDEQNRLGELSRYIETMIWGLVPDWGFKFHFDVEREKQEFLNLENKLRAENDIPEMTEENLKDHFLKASRVSMDSFYFFSYDEVRMTRHMRCSKKKTEAEKALAWYEKPEKNAPGCVAKVESIYDLIPYK